MKKNITINLFGTLYNIDEDAYALLENYLQSMQRYFSRQEGGEEIADDIEHRVAELLWQRREAGMQAVNIEIVKEIIATIGNAEEISEGNEQKGNEEKNGQAGSQTEEGACEADGKAKTSGSFKEDLSHLAKETGKFARETYDKGRNHVKTHRFYRRRDDIVLGGVCSGMALYFEGNDVLLWRLGTVVATILLSCIGIGIVIPVIYILLWALAPLAITPEDRLRMQGKDITPENLTQQVVEESQASNVQQNHRETASGCMKAILVVLGVFLLIPLVVIFITLVMALVMVLGNTTGLWDSLIGSIPFMQAFSSFAEATQTSLLMALVCGLLVIIIPIYGVIRLIRASNKKLSTGIVTALIIGWILALGLSIVAIVATCTKGDEWSNKDLFADRLAMNKKYMQSQGWKLKSQTNLNPWFAEERTGFCDLPHYAFNLEANKMDSINYTARFAKDINLEEGHYMLMTLTQGGQEGLTYTFRYKDNGETKDAVIHTTAEHVCLWNIPFEEVGQYSQMFHNPDSIGWENFAHDDENWILQQADIPHADAGTGTIFLNAVNCTLQAKIRDIKIVKVD